MKLKQKTLAIALVMALICGMCFAATGAAYTDVAGGSWYTNAVNYVTENHLMDPISANAFAPDTDAAPEMWE